MSKEEDPLERSIRRLDEALKSSPSTRFSSTHTFSPFTTPSLLRINDHEESMAFDTEKLERKQLRRSELLGLSIALEPDELSQLCNLSGVVTERTLLNVDSSIENLLSQFQSTFQTLGSIQNVFEAISSFVEICSNTIDALYRTQNLTEDLTWLVNERNTWRLINALYKDRSVKYEEICDESMMEYVHERSEKELQEYFYKSNRSVREMQIVVDWLERIARDEWTLMNRAEVGHYTDRTVAWENTLHSLQAGDRALYRPSRPTVTSLDPDAPRRQGRPLHDIDHDDDRRLLQQVFVEIRCGRLDKAEEHCLHCGQQWRAATLEGWRLHHDPNYLKQSTDGTKLPTEGNPHRDVWKLCAWELCCDPHTPQEERAVMGALCGHLPSLLAEAQSWEDLLWAEGRAFIDIRVERDVRDNSSKTYVEMPSEYWNNWKSVESIFTNVKAHDKGRPESNHPDRVIQELIIMDNITELLNRCSGWAEGQCQIQFLRFMAHLVLILRLLGKFEPLHFGNNVLSAYMKALTANRNPDLISYYASLLPEEKQIELFSDYMEELGETGEKTEILKAAEKYGLNIKAITERAVQNIRNRQLDVSADSSLVKETTEDDLKKISALDWMVYYEQQRVEAIWECNALLRVFIAEGKLPAARLAHNKIPEDSVSLIVSQYNVEVDQDFTVHWESFPPKVNAALKEHLCYKAYLDAHDGFNHWFHQFHNTKPVEPTKPSNADFTEMMAYEHKFKKYQQELERWNISMDHITKNVQSQLQNTLLFPPDGWLVDDYAEDEVRMQHLERLRAICIPQIFSLLHKVLYSMGRYEEATDIFTFLVREKFDLLKVFSQQQKEDLVRRIEETSEKLLMAGGNPFGHKCLIKPESISKPAALGELLKSFPKPELSSEEEMIFIPPKEEEGAFNLLDFDPMKNNEFFGFDDDENDEFSECDGSESAYEPQTSYRPLNISFLPDYILKRRESNFSSMDLN